MTGAEVVSVLGLLLTIAAHLVVTVWWAASITRRVDHIERWIVHNEHTAERLAALEQQIQNLGTGISRIEHYLRHKP